MKRIALVNQRYGKEVNGGSEYYTAMLAQQLKKKYRVDILTTTALSYESWDNFYEEGETGEDGITIRRFKVQKPRRRFMQSAAGKILNLFHLRSQKINDIWVKSQGPYVPQLIEYIRDNTEKYDVLIFVTYLYYTTVFGMPEIKHKSIFIPTAHDEYCIYFKAYEALFSMPKGIVYLTEEEKEFVNRTFHNENIPSKVIGMGVVVPENVDAGIFRKKYKISGEYVIYIGRVDENKGCAKMFEVFADYITTPNQEKNLELVVIGQQFMDIPSNEHIHYLGFVSEEDKFNGIGGAKALWLPSEYESLSISVLEAMALGKPVLVNGKCEVLKGHCKKSGGGFYYKDMTEALEHLKRLTSMNVEDEEYKEMSEGACNYVSRNYSWDKIMDEFEEMIGKAAK